MELKFYVIFTAGTVRYLAPAFHTLLQQSHSLKFAVVGNGLSADEWESLTKLTRYAPGRIQIADVPSFSTIPHGLALNFLARRSSDSYFAFCDSDIFALNQFEDKFSTDVSPSTIFSSCSRLEHTPGAIYLGGFGGAASMTECGRQMAGSFFCVYPRDIMSSISKQFGVGFEQVARIDQIPRKARDFLKSRGIKEEKFDTGKLLSLLMADTGCEIRHRELSALAHIGGLSGELVRPRKNVPFILTDSSFPAPRLSDNAAALPQARSEEHRVAKRAITQYFAALLRSHVDGDPRPEMQVSSPIYKHRLDAIAIAIDSSFGHFRC